MSCSNGCRSSTCTPSVQARPDQQSRSVVEGICRLCVSAMWRSHEVDHCIDCANASPITATVNFSWSVLHERIVHEAIKPTLSRFGRDHHGVMLGTGMLAG